MNQNGDDDDNANNKTAGFIKHFMVLYVRKYVYEHTNTQPTAN